MRRRAFLQFVATLPFAAALLAFVSPLFRLLRPTAGPFEFFRPPDTVAGEAQLAAKLSELTTPWAAKEFEFVQHNVEYTPQGTQTSRIPGFVVHVPEEYAQKAGAKNGLVVYSRICTHLGCIFNYVTDPAELAKGYNYRPPVDTPHFACPCHLSVFDIANGGKVVSGPAPRPPRRLEFVVEGDEIKIIGVEAGGIA